MQRSQLIQEYNAPTNSDNNLNFIILNKLSLNSKKMAFILTKVVKLTIKQKRFALHTKKGQP
uniref:hypothetical protein n=1 Tax=Candidatus Thiodubiliella endoseptemdiera TaxID=2738886 RepID=UPI0034E02CC3